MLANGLLPRATAILGELHEIKAEIQTEIREGYGTLQVGFIPTIAPLSCHRVIRRFSQEFPHANLEVHEDLTDELIRKIIVADLDVGITSLPINNKLIHTEVLLTETSAWWPLLPKVRYSLACFDPCQGVR